MVSCFKVPEELGNRMIVFRQPWPGESKSFLFVVDDVLSILTENPCTREPHMRKHCVCSFVIGIYSNSITSLNFTTQTAAIVCVGSKNHCVQYAFTCVFICVWARECMCVCVSVRACKYIVFDLWIVILYIYMYANAHPMSSDYVVLKACFEGNINVIK
jgi:hypothetical protein